MKKDDLNLDDFTLEKRNDADFDAFDSEEKPVKPKKIKKEEFDISVDDEQDALLEDLEEFDDDGDPVELNFDR